MFAVLVAAALLVPAALPVRADTADELAAARASLARVQATLDELAATYAGAQARLARQESAVEDLRERISGVRARMARIRSGLGLRAREAYESGALSTLDMLLSSDSFSQFSDRVQYLGSVAQGDSQLLLRAEVAGEELRRDRSALLRLSRRQAATVADLAAAKRDIAAQLASAQALEEKLQARQAAERLAAAKVAAAAEPTKPGGPLQACPVGQPRTFFDDFGDPRPGGRTHQGIDMLAPLGTPIYAAQSGRFEKNYNDLGGISALLYAANGDYTYYAHMSSYAGVRDGATVSAGTMIGHVGNTGDAQGGPYHLHFEYHPGGGGAVDPYQDLLNVCS